MPTYVYECSQCGHGFELFQKMSDPPEEICPKCGGKVNRIPSAGAGIIFKGSGFYATDYRSREYKEKAKSEGSNGSSPKTAAPKDKGASKNEG